MLFNIGASNAAKTDIAQKMLEVFDSMCFLAAPEFEGIETTVAGFGGKELSPKLALTDPVMAENNGRAFKVPYAGALFVLGITEIGTCAVVAQDRIANQLRESILKNYPVRKAFEIPSGVQITEYFMSKTENPYTIGIVESKSGTTTAATVLQYAPPGLADHPIQR
ncbi:MAG: hypothetical protein KUL86_07645 [Castellaniella sp.]|nr:hypothetical protein [Castellaniella sp.]